MFMERFDGILYAGVIASKYRPTDSKSRLLGYYYLLCCCYCVAYCIIIIIIWLCATFVVNKDEYEYTINHYVSSSSSKASRTEWLVAVSTKFRPVYHHFSCLSTPPEAVCSNFRSQRSFTVWVYTIQLGRPWLSRQTGPISSGVTRNSGPLHKYSSTAFASLPAPGLPISLPRSLSSSSWLCPSLPSPINGVNRLTCFNIWRGGRPTWNADQPTHLSNARQSGGSVRP